MKLRAENLVKTYKGRSVVKGISVEVNQGEIVGLLGPNGAGKTTSFYMIVGLVKPNSGKIFLDDLDITDYPMYKRAQNGIGYLAQEASVFRKLSIEDNILSVLQLTKLTKKEQVAKMENLIAEFSLEHIRTNRGDLLSGGERRRTEIARALATDPKFILLDEPFAGVDPVAVEDIQRIVAPSIKEVGSGDNIVGLRGNVVSAGCIRAKGKRSIRSAYGSQKPCARFCIRREHGTVAIDAFGPDNCTDIRHGVEQHRSFTKDGTDQPC